MSPVLVLSACCRMLLQWDVLTDGSDEKKIRRKYDETFKREAIASWQTSGKWAQEIALGLLRSDGFPFECSIVFSPSLLFIGAIREHVPLQQHPTTSAQNQHR